MEACGTCHYWARRIEGLGHAVVLLPPHLVRPDVRGNKTDRTDAKALVEAFRNGELRPVPIKTVEQQTLTTLHRLREGWITQRTARLNALRAMLREQGTFIPVGARCVVPAVWAAIEDAEVDLARPLRALFAEACLEICDIERRIKMVERELEALAKQTPAVDRLMKVPGIGLLTATALAGFVGDFRRFPTARHFASYLGLTPREHSSGTRRHLGRISKRGDVYVRALLTHGARSLLRAAQIDATKDRLRAWAVALGQRAHRNKTAVALANKIARIAWAVSVKNADYRALPIPTKAA